MTLRDIGDFEFHPEAAAELESALDRYLGYSAYTGDRFRAAIRTQLNDILA